jgi:hypothetical protein
MIAPGPNCQAGYYCPIGSATDTEYPCPAGSQCPSGSANHLLCGPGFYQPFALSATCETCPVGRYCPTTGAKQSLMCPAGYFC